MLIAVNCTVSILIKRNQWEGEIRALSNNKPGLGMNLCLHLLHPRRPFLPRRPHHHLHHPRLRHYRFAFDYILHCKAGIRADLFAYFGVLIASKSVVGYYGDVYCYHVPRSRLWRRFLSWRLYAVVC